jgi:hypothetical protein
VGQEINSGLALKMLGPSVKSLGATMFFFFFFFFFNTEKAKSEETWAVSATVSLQRILL